MILNLHEFHQQKFGDDFLVSITTNTYIRDKEFFVILYKKHPILDIESKEV